MYGDEADPEQTERILRTIADEDGWELDPNELQTLREAHARLRKSLTGLRTEQARLTELGIEPAAAMWWIRGGWVDG